VEVDLNEIWVLDVMEDILTRLTTSSEINAALPVWTPDGSRIVFAAKGSDTLENIFWAAADFSGDIGELLDHEHIVLPTSFSPSGHLAIYEVHPAEQRNILVVPPDGASPRDFVRTSFNERALVISPDGHWCAYVSDRSGRDEIYIEPFPEGGRRLQVSDSGGSEPQWAPNGGELFYRNRWQMIAVPITTEPEVGLTGGRMILFEDDSLVANQFVPNYDVHPDNQRFLMVEDVAPRRSGQRINIVLNWFEELERLTRAEW
jgi:Tol biopolymer transport system component